MKIYVNFASVIPVPKFLYHATYRPLLPMIKARGLGHSETRKNYEDSVAGIVYLSDDPNVAESYAETSDMVDEDWLDAIIILKIATDSLDATKFLVDRNNLAEDTFEYHGTIPTSAIVSIK